MSEKNLPEETQNNEGDKINEVPVAEEQPGVNPDDAIIREMSHRTRRSFLVAGVATVAGVVGWNWLKTRPEVDGIPAPLRSMLKFNEKISQSYFSAARLAPTFARSKAVEPRVNGGEGMSDDFDPALWRLQVIGVADQTKYKEYRQDISYQTSTATENLSENFGPEDDQEDEDDAKDSPDETDADNSEADNSSEHPAADEMKQAGLLLTLDDIKTLPRVEMTTELKCIEGWSVVVNWAGARLSDFMAKYQPITRNQSAPDVLHRPQDVVGYVGLETPDGGYYVGLDLESALHPQTLLCYEMNGRALSLEHGAPLRLVTPTKYGIKHIKRIGRITFTDIRPADFWAERGYDWYAGH